VSVWMGKGWVRNHVCHIQLSFAFERTADTLERWILSSITISLHSYTKAICNLVPLKVKYTKAIWCCWATNMQNHMQKKIKLYHIQGPRKPSQLCGQEVLHNNLTFLWKCNASSGCKMSCGMALQIPNDIY